MIDGNVLKFGYGDISVGADAWGAIITFQQFKPPAQCGENVPENVEYIGEKISFEISYKEYEEFDMLLKQVQNRKISKFVFKGYEFNFENYKEESVRVCIHNLKNAISFLLLCMAA